MAELNRQQSDELEKLVDASSLSDVLDALANICQEKGDHLRSNWQDAASARVWETAGRMISKLAAKIDI